MLSAKDLPFTGNYSSDGPEPNWACGSEQLARTAIPTLAILS